MSLRRTHAPTSGHGRRPAALLSITIAATLATTALGTLPQADAATAATAATLSWVGASSSGGSRTAHVVRVPARVVAGDTMVLFMSTNSRKGTISNPSGWRLLQARNTATKARVWTKRAVAGDASKVLSVRTTKKVKGTLSISAYRSSARVSAITATAVTTANAAAETSAAPAVRVSQAGSWLVNLYAGKSNKPTAFTQATGTTRRTSASTAGRGRIAAMVTDTGRAVATGTAPSRVARTSRPLSARQLFSVVISPGVVTTTPPPTPSSNRAPVASFTTTCNSLACEFDGTSSTDVDGDPLTYAWSFGDSSTGTGATPSHVYATPATRNVTLAVSDGKATTSLTHSVAATTPEALPGHTSLVPETPRIDMPKISSGSITDLEVAGSRVYAAGSFTSIQNQRGTDTTSYSQPYLAAYDLETGLVDAGFRPTFAGNPGFTVDAVEASPDGTRLYVAGSFNTVNNVTRKGVVELDPTTGATVTAFKADTDARATELAVTSTTVYIGGRFAKVNTTGRKSLASVDAVTGAIDPAFVNNLSGGIGVNGGLTVQKLLLTHDGTKLVVIHTGRQVNGLDRYGIAMIDTVTKQLLPWRTRLWDDNLQFVGGVQRIISGSIAPDDSYFVVVSGSGGDRPPINDTIVAYTLSSSSNAVQPRWISRAFDSVYTTAVSEDAVYIGGHFAWNESPSAPDPWPGAAEVGYGTGQGLSGYGLGDSVVNREHLGALNPTDGKALEWNPGSNSFEGNTAMALTPRGLITGGDASTQGGLNVGRLAFFDLSSVPAPNGVTTKITSPISGRVVGAGEPFMFEGTATAVAGVRKVSIEVQNRGTQLWLQDDLATWGGANTIDSTLATPNATSTAWSLPLTIQGNVKLFARAKTQDLNMGEAATKATKKFETFGLGDAPPTVAYSAPLAGLVKSKTFVISGTTADDLGVTGISMTLKNSAGRFLQDDGSVDGTYNALSIILDVPNATSTTWSREVTVPTEGAWKAQTRARDTGGNSSLDTTDRIWTVSANGAAPSVSISAPGSVVPPTAPQVVTIAPGSPMTFSGSATDDSQVKSIDISLVNNSTGQNLAVDGSWGYDNGANRYRLASGINQQSYNWSYTTGFNLPSGNYTFAVLATDDEGITTPQTSWAILTVNAVVPGDAPPKATLTAAGLQAPGQSLDIDVAGRAADDHGVDEVRLVVKDYDASRYMAADGALSSTYTTVPATVATRGSTSTSWSRHLTLPTQGSWNVTAYAVDTVSQRDLATTGATARYPVYPGGSAPTLTDSLLAPTEGSSLTDGRIFVSGRAEDDTATSKVEVAVIDSSNRYLTSANTFSGTETWRATFLTSPGTPGSNFSYTTPVLPVGGYTVKVRAIDQHGLVTPVPSVRHVTVSVPPGNTRPVAVLPAPVCNANVCKLDARGSTDENAATLTYTWNFGNGSGTGPNPSRTYTAAGTYSITLTAKDEWGVLSAPVSRTVTITEPAGNAAPTPVIQAPACSRLSCNFSGVGTADPNAGDVITYAWNFGDRANNTATGAATAHVFTAPGTYAVRLTTTDGWGKTALVTRSVTVVSP